MSNIKKVAGASAAALLLAVGIASLSSNEGRSAAKEEHTFSQEHAARRWSRWHPDAGADVAPSAFIR